MLVKYIPYYSVQPGRLNDDCTDMNKMGALCGECLPDHYPLAYSFNMTCVPCPHARWNWLWYIMAAYLPLTLFYFVILFFKINTHAWSHTLQPFVFARLSPFLSWFV